MFQRPAPLRNVGGPGGMAAGRGKGSGGGGGSEGAKQGSKGSGSKFEKRFEYQDPEALSSVEVREKTVITVASLNQEI